MRLFWKQFLCMVGLVMASFAIFGCLLIHNSFQMSLDREKEQSLQTLRMYQYSMLASLEYIPNTTTMSDSALSYIAETVYNNMGDSENIVTLYNENGDIIFESRKAEIHLMDSLNYNEMGVQRITTVHNDHFLQSIIKRDSTAGTFYLEMSQSIQELYESRQVLYESYQKILLLVFVVTIILAVALSLQLAKPVKRLSVVTGKFADGDYKSRVKEKGHDEVADLMKDFNTMADKLESNIVELKESARRQEEFTGAFAHELKTPLTSIIGYAEALCSMKMTEEEMLSSAGYIYHQGKRLEGLSYKMMELTGIEKQEWKFSSIRVQLLVEHVKDMTEGIRTAKNIDLQCEIEQGNIYGDLSLLESLLSNLVDNARKASLENSSILLCGKSLPTGYQIQVIDHGCGIPQEEIAKIHEAFYMVDKSRARKEGGAGIGMALCEKILQMHNGKWNIDSVVGEGTTITLCFPEVAPCEE